MHVLLTVILRSACAIADGDATKNLAAALSKNQLPMRAVLFAGEALP
ncbi:MAG: hypothetical protein M1132_13485 [Chloroflexi bacterium]|nr:hypothetical protein [Chloroflexota bacterium]